MWCSFMFPIWVLKIPQHVSKSNNKEQYNGLFKPKDNTIDNKQIIITIQSLANLLTNKWHGWWHDNLILIITFKVRASFRQMTSR